jgi:hypothetical protein
MVVSLEKESLMIDRLLLALRKQADRITVIKTQCGWLRSRLAGRLL